MNNLQIINKYKVQASNSNETLCGPSELSRWLGISPQAVDQMRKTGFLIPDDNGKYKLRECVSKYITKLRTERKGENAETLEEEILYWKKEKLKTENEKWRMQRDRLVAGIVIDSMFGILLKIKNKIEQGEDIAKEIEAIIDKGAQINANMQLCEITEMNDEN